MLVSAILISVVFKSAATGIFLGICLLNQPVHATATRPGDQTNPLNNRNAHDISGQHIRGVGFLYPGTILPADDAADQSLPGLLFQYPDPVEAFTRISALVVSTFIVYITSMRARRFVQKETMDSQSSQLGPSL